MSNGKMIYSGSKTFLKNKFDIGYNLTCILLIYWRKISILNIQIERFINFKYLSNLTRNTYLIILYKYKNKTVMIKNTETPSNSIIEYVKNQISSYKILRSISTELVF